eukprot:jgi/Hompol1/5582/HPOL_004556-RA
MQDFFSIATYEETAAYLRERLPQDLKTVSVGVVCGSGLGGLVKTLDSPVEFDYHVSTVHPYIDRCKLPGHAGKLVFGYLSGKPTVCMVGRFHAYEGHSLQRTVYPIRVMKLLGVSTLIVTNAAGGLNPTFNVGDIMLIADHVSMAGFGGFNALIGPNIEQFGVRFPPVSDAYDFDLRVTAVKAAHASGIPANILREGTYTFVAGPSFETRAEARYLRDAAKADCVGMSTVPEVIAARHAGIRVLGISLITNKVSVGKGRSAIAAGSIELGLTPAETQHDNVHDDELQVASHHEVLETSAARAVDMQRLVKKIVEIMPSPRV